MIEILASCKTLKVLEDNWTLELSARCIFERPGIPGESCVKTLLSFWNPIYGIIENFCSSPLAFTLPQGVGEGEGLAINEISGKKMNIYFYLYGLRSIFMVMFLFLRPVLDTVSGLRWGDYLGSPADSVEPKLAVNEVIGAQQIVSVTTGEIIGLTESTCVITHEVKSGMYCPYPDLCEQNWCEVYVSSFIWSCHTTNRKKHIPQHKLSEINYKTPPCLIRILQ